MYRVLIVDSGSAPTRKIASALTESGFEVITASFESEGLKIADWAFPDVIIIKESSQLDGHKLCQHIRYLFDLPIILVDDKPEEEVYPTNIENGTDWDFYMRLPISHQELVARIKVLLRRYGKAGGVRNPIVSCSEFYFEAIQE